MALSSVSLSKSVFTSHWEEHLQVAQGTFETLGDVFEEVVSLCVKKLKAGGKLLFFGNGGSAADAQHLATEFTVRFRHPRPCLPALALTTDTSALTAIGNDLGYDQVFARQLEALAQPEDVVIAISTSGTSPNIIAGLKQAERMGLARIGLSGSTGGDMTSLCSLCLLIPSTTTARIQEMHIALGQMMCAAIEEIIYPYCA
jgi:D-sedoheptulose 7-phosphate isomerase